MAGEHHGPARAAPGEPRQHVAHGGEAPGEGHDQGLLDGGLVAQPLQLRQNARADLGVRRAAHWMGGMGTSVAEQLAQERMGAARGELGLRRVRGERLGALVAVHDGCEQRAEEDQGGEGPAQLPAAGGE